MPKLERKRKAAGEERAAANAARAKLEVDVADLEEQIERHAQTQAGLSDVAAGLLLCPLQHSKWWQYKFLRCASSCYGRPFGLVRPLLVRFSPYVEPSCLESAEQTLTSTPHTVQADCSATAQSLEAEVEARQAELVDVRAEQQAREAQAAELDRQIAESERRLQVCPMVPVTLSGRACLQWPHIPSSPPQASWQSMPLTRGQHGHARATLSVRMHWCQAIHLSKGTGTTAALMHG